MKEEGNRENPNDRSVLPDVAGTGVQVRGSRRACKEPSAIEPQLEGLLISGFTKPGKASQKRLKMA